MGLYVVKIIFLNYRYIEHFNIYTVEFTFEAAKTFKRNVDNRSVAIYLNSVQPSWEAGNIPQFQLTIASYHPAILSPSHPPSLYIPSTVAAYFGQIKSRGI